MTDMYEEEGVDFDPITALATINSARENFIAADRAQDAAIHARNLAMEQLNSAQQEYDRVTAYLKSHAPVGSHWWMQKHHPSVRKSPF